MVDSELRRVAVHADTGTVDLALPAGLPVAELLPVIVGIVGEQRDAAGPAPGVCYHLSRPGGTALDPALTLAQQRIQDGTLLVLTRPPPRPPAPRCDDPAEVLCTLSRPRRARAGRVAGAVAAGWLAGMGGLMLARSAWAPTGLRHPGITAAVAAAVGGTALVAATLAHRVHGDRVAAVTLGLLATGFAAAAGFVAVPDGPGPPNVVLAAMAAAAVAVTAGQLTGCGAVTFPAVACAAALTTAAALAGVLTGAPPRTLGGVGATAALGLLGCSGRAAVASAGLARVGTARAEQIRARAQRAADRLSALVAGCAAAAALGAVTAALGDPALTAAGFAALIGAALLLRAGSAGDPRRAVVLLAAGMVAVSAAFAAAAAVVAAHPPWICAGTAALAGTALWLGLAAPTARPSPLTRRGAELAEYLLLASVVPVAVWLCGLYDVARALTLW